MYLCYGNGSAHGACLLASVPEWGRDDLVAISAWRLNLSRQDYVMHMVARGAERLLSGVLDQMAVNLQLGRTQFVRATQGYQGVTTWLADRDSPLYGYSPHL